MRVLVTRAAEDAPPLSQALEAAGHQPVVVPLIERVPTGAPPPGEAAPDWVFWTSAAAVRLATSLPSASHAAVGEATAAALRSAGAQVAVTGTSTGAALAHQLQLDGRTVLYPCASQVAPGTREALEAAGALVLPWVVYDNRLPVGAGEALAFVAVDRALLLSPSAARRLAAYLRVFVPVVCIGPTTAAAAREVGLEVAGVAASPSIEGLVQALGSTSAG